MCAGEVQYWLDHGGSEPPDRVAYLRPLSLYPQRMPFILGWSDAGLLRLAGIDRTQLMTLISHCEGPRCLVVRPPS